MFADTGSHMMDLILWLVGSGATEVSAQIENAAWPVENYLGLQARLANSAFLSGAFSFGVSGGGSSPLEYTHMTIIGDKGVLAAEITPAVPEPTIWVDTLACAARSNPRLRIRRLPLLSSHRSRWRAKTSLRLPRPAQVVALTEPSTVRLKSISRCGLSKLKIVK